jgi:hypothetical protein
MTRSLEDGRTEYAGQPKRVDKATAYACFAGPPADVEVIKDRPATVGTANATTTNTAYSTSGGVTTATTTTSTSEIGIPIPGWKVVRVRC